MQKIIFETSKFLTKNIFNQNQNQCMRSHRPRGETAAAI